MGTETNLPAPNGGQDSSATVASSGVASAGAAIKDHIFFVVLGFCAAAAGGSWVVSEKVRVVPLEMRLADETRKLNDQLAKANEQQARADGLQKSLEEKKTPPPAQDKDAPTITNAYVTLRQEATLKVDQHIEFSDPNGDATFINFVVLRTNATNLIVQSASIRAPSDEQIKGAIHRGTWDCGGGTYNVVFRAIVTDERGHASQPRDYVIDCKG